MKGHDASKQSSALKKILAISHFLLFNMTSTHGHLCVFSCFLATMFESKIDAQSNDTHASKGRLGLRVNSHSHLHAHSTTSKHLETHSAHLLKTISTHKNCHWSTGMTKTSVRNSGSVRMQASQGATVNRWWSRTASDPLQNGLAIYEH